MGMMLKNIVCTIVDDNYLSQALISQRSFKEYNPLIDYYILVSNFENIDCMAHPSLVGIDELEDRFPQIATMKSYYDVVEFSTAIKPYFIMYLVEKTRARINYVDPDTLFFAALPTFLESLEDDEIGLTPHRLTPSSSEGLLDGQFLKYGVFNLGFCSVGIECIDFLEWWQSKLFRHSTRYQDHYIFTDQKWIDIAAVYFKIKVLRFFGLNVASWNFDERAPRKIAGEWICQNGEKLIFFHFSQLSSLLVKEVLDLESLVVRFSKMEKSVELELKKMLKEYSIELRSLQGDVNIKGSKITNRYLRSENLRRFSRGFSLQFRKLSRFKRLMAYLDRSLLFFEKSSFLRCMPELIVRDFRKLIRKIS